LSPAVDTVIFAETPEGIAIGMRAAGFPVRCCAFLIDSAARYAVVATVAQVLARSGRFGVGILFVVAFCVIWLYPVIFELPPAAATPGKRAMGIRVMMANGLPITPAGCLTRNLLRTVDMLPLFYGFGLVCMLLRRDGRRLGDLAGGTLVVYKDQSPPAGDFGTGEPIAPPASLTGLQQAAIARFAWRVSRLTAERAAEIAAIAGADARRLVGFARWLNGERRAPMRNAAGRP
jgi:uncharacterized RDD family membrane protein YckC